MRSKIFLAPGKRRYYETTLSTLSELDYLIVSPLKFIPVIVIRQLKLIRIIHINDLSVFGLGQQQLRESISLVIIVESFKS